jgi:hypothetical protein
MPKGLMLHGYPDGPHFLAVRMALIFLAVGNLSGLLSYFYFRQTRQSSKAVCCNFGIQALYRVWSRYADKADQPD